LARRKDGFAGIENLTIGRLTDDYVVRFEARAIPANGDYRFAFQWEKADTFYLKASYQQFRIDDDGSGGRLPPRDLAISYFPEDLAVDRSYFSVEVGNVVSDGVRWHLRYDHNTRSGSKNSLRWGDSNLGGPAFTVRAFIPSYLLLDEARDIVTAEASRRTETANWKAAGRYERSRVNNTHVARRRATEPQDRYLTMNEGTSTDLFSGHAHYERFFSKELRMSAGGLATTIDTNLSGNRIYGTTPRAAYLPVVAGGQANDAGYIDLGGKSQLKQYIGNVNLYYQVTKHLSVLPAVKFEHPRSAERQDPHRHFPQRQHRPSHRNALRRHQPRLVGRGHRGSRGALPALAQPPSFHPRPMESGHRQSRRAEHPPRDRHHCP